MSDRWRCSSGAVWKALLCWHSCILVEKVFISGYILTSSPKHHVHDHVHIFIALCNITTFMILHNSLFFPCLLSRTRSGGFHKMCILLLTVFFINIVILITFALHWNVHYSNICWSETLLTKNMHKIGRAQQKCHSGISLLWWNEILLYHRF